MLYRLLIIIIIALIVSLSSAQDYEIITPENASQLERVAQLGHGYVTDVWFEDNETLVVGDYYGGDEWQYDINNMSTSPIFRPAPIRPIIEPELSINYAYPSSDDGRWLVTNDGIWSNETGEQVMAFTGGGYIETRLLIANYLVIWRSSYREDKSLQCSQENPCGNHILIMNTFTKQLYGELFIDDVTSVNVVLNRTHLAVTRNESTDFYSLLQSDGLEFVFSLPTRLQYFNDKGTYGIEKKDNHLILWNLQTRAIQMRLNYLEGELIYFYHLSDDGRYLAVATTAERVKPDTYLYMYPQKNIGIWDTHTGKRISLIDYFAPRLTMEFSPDGRYFVLFSQSDVFFSGDRDIFFLTVYENDTGRQIFQMDNGLRRPASAMAFSPDSSLLAITFYDGRVVLVDTRTGDTLADIAGYGGYVEHVNFYDDHIITSNSDGHSDWWSTDSFELVRREQTCPIIGIDSVTNKAFCKQFEATVLGVDNWEVFPTKLQNLTKNETITLDHEQLATDWLFNTVFSPDGESFITLGNSTSRSPIIWDAKTYELISLLDDPNHYYGARDVQYLSDGAYIGSQSDLVVWDAKTFEVAVNLPYSAGINELGVYSDAGDWVAFPNEYETTITIWRLSELYTNPNPEPIIELTDYPSATLSASPDGRLLLVSTYQNTTLIETENFTVVHRYHGGGLDIQFSPDGHYIVHANGIDMSGGADESLHIGSAQVWAVPSN